MKKIFSVSVLTVCAVLFTALSISFADDCVTCHRKHGVEIKVPSVTPIRIKVDGNIQTIDLSRAFKFHGHECPGMTIAYRAVQYGIDLLFRGEVPERKDLLVISKTPAAGVKDFIDLLMKGDKHSERTWPPVGMEKGRDKFVFTIMRKSTSEAVEVALNQDCFPVDFFLLKKKEKEKSISSGEWKKLHAYMKDIVLGYPGKPAEELFGKPQIHKMIMWGTLEPGEMDKNIRKLRQEEKKKALQGVKNEK